jgi:hypothetical protein
VIVRSFVIASSAIFALALSVPAHATPSPAGLPQGEPSVVELQVQGADPLPTEETIPHWHGQFTDPTNGVTYGYNMVGANPAAQADTTVHVDLIPLNFVFPTYNVALNGSDIIPNLLASPIFHSTDFTATPKVTGPMDADQHVQVLPGGPLSAGNTGVQLEDAIMRSQFDEIGTTYHLRLAPTVWPAQTFNVPPGYGAVFRTTRGTVWGEQNFGLSEIPALTKLHLDPTHLWVFVTNNVFVGQPGHWCCILGIHLASLAQEGGNTANQGIAAVPTWIYASYIQPGTFDPATAPLESDVTVFDHEIAEWADDPFDDNVIDPWNSPLPPQNGCLSWLEVGDPVDRVAYTLPGNTYDTGPYADGYWHLQDDMFLPWYARQAPNTTSQLSQSGADGRYSFMGDLNPYPAFHRPAMGC